MSDILPIHEVFDTWQGEGCYAGQHAFFIRTMGCPLHCPWCDSAGTWHAKYLPKQVQRLRVEDLAEAAYESCAPIVVITGGEPTIHDLLPLTNVLQLRGMRTHLETSGAFPIRGNFDWVTVSPKRAKLPLLETLRRANEFKLIITQPSDIDYWLTVLADALIPNGNDAKQVIWLHPEWSQRNNPEVLNAITRAVTRRLRGYVVRAGYQLHKLYKADALDSRSAPTAPLGGNPDRGQ